MQSLFASNVGYTGPDVWRWGGIQNNGFDRSDPRFEEFAMIGADGLTHDRQGRLILATLAGRSLMRIEKDGTASGSAARTMSWSRATALIFDRHIRRVSSARQGPAQGARLQRRVHVEGRQAVFSS